VTLALRSFLRRARLRPWERVRTRHEQRVVCGDCGPQVTSSFDRCPSCGGLAEPLTSRKVEKAAEPTLLEQWRARRSARRDYRRRR
jgi:tRNA(Ile2) C34 agmatinyltransferase TiaS